jgi:hypothetical protein
LHHGTAGGERCTASGSRRPYGDGVWRRGIAATLVEEGERRLRAKGARRFHLIVLEDEAPAQAFWTAAGYERQENRLRYVKTFPAKEANDG